MYKRASVWRWSAPALLVVLLSCADPTGVCACPPATYDALVFGRVQDATGAAVARARLQAFVGPAGCALAGAVGGGEGTAAPDGSYRVYVRAAAEPEPGTCIRIRALPASGDTAGASAWIPFAVTFGVSQVVDSARVDLVLP